MEANAAGRPENGASLREALSSRELEVLEMTSHGYTNSEIAGRLNVTVHAVKFHLGSVYKKLGVTNRTEAAVAYLASAQLNGASESLD